MNTNLLKAQYEELVASESLRGRVDGIFRKERRYRRIKRSLPWAAMLIIIIGVFNLSPALAVAAYEIPVIGDIIRVITIYRFEYKQNGYEAEIIVPEIQGLLEQELQDRLNAEFSNNADALIAAFEQDVIELTSEFDEELVHLSVKSDYTVKTDNDKVLSIDTYIYSDVSSYLIHKFYNIDKSTGTFIRLMDLFEPDSDYITPISAYIAGEMLRINKEEDGLFEIGDSPFGGFTEIMPEQNFYINNEGNLVICFDKYEVAAGVQGSPEFIIPQNVIKDISDSNLINNGK